MNIIPKPVRGVMMHQRVLGNNRMIDVYILDNLCLECTFLLSVEKNIHFKRRVCSKLVQLLHLYQHAGQILSYLNYDL